MKESRIPLVGRYLAWLDGLCACLLSIAQNQCAEAFQGRGVVVPESQVALALSGQAPIEPQPGFAGELEALEAAEADADEPLARLFSHLGRDGLARLAVLLALAPEVNRKYERIFAYLQDDAAQRQATLGLCADLWSLVAPLEDGALFALCDGKRLLSRCILAPGRTGLSCPLVLRESALYFLTDTPCLPEHLGRVAQLLPAEETPELLANAGLAGQAARFARFYLEKTEKTTGLLQLYGGAGTGRRFLLRYVAGMTGRPVLLLDCARLAGLPDAERRTAAECALSWAFLHGAVPALYRFDFAGFSQQDRLRLAQELLDTFQGGLPLLALCGEKPLKLRFQEGFRTLQLNIPDPSIGQQQKYWSALAAPDGLPLGEGLDPRQLASVYALAPGQIAQVLALAESDCISRGQKAIDRQAIAQGVRLLCSPRLAELTEPLRPSFTWDDLEVGDEAMEKLRRLCDRIRCRWQVNEKWGFDRRLPYGKGVSVCLYGPPGTGKTMTAQVLAREFGLDAYRVDMSRIMDKYIGETEKKLAELFDAARDSNAILFFDEADALFAKRTEVSDSKDRYANVETAYLLQRMENHNGISILATNAVQNFDEAFKRRISYLISLPMPDAETRKRLWHKVFPAEAPLEGVNLDFFAQRFELTGSSIKNVALTAAYLAAAGGGSIGREELVEAVREEYHKTGRVLMEHELY